MSQWIEDYNGTIKLPNPTYGTERRVRVADAGLQAQAHAPQQISWAAESLGKVAGAAETWADVMAKQVQEKQKLEALDWTMDYQDREREMLARMAEKKSKDGFDNSVKFAEDWYKSANAELIKKARGGFQKDYLSSFLAHSQNAGLNRAYAHRSQELDRYHDQVWEGRAEQTMALIEADPENWERHLAALDKEYADLNPGADPTWLQAKARQRRDKGLEVAILSLAQSGKADEAKRLFLKAYGEDSGQEASGLTSPLAGNPVISSRFGHRTAPMTPKGPGSEYHEGIDYAVPVGTPIMAAGAGKVVFVGDTGGGYGLQVKIDHGNDWESWYSHLSDTGGLQVGDTVTQGQPIALSGGAKGDHNAGKSTGPHMHFSVKQDGQFVDPEKVLSGVSLSKRLELWKKLQDMEANQVKTFEKDLVDSLDQKLLAGTLTVDDVRVAAPHLSHTNQTFYLQGAAGEAGFLAEKQKLVRQEAERAIKAGLEFGDIRPSREAITRFIVENDLAPYFRPDHVRDLVKFAEEEKGKTSKVIDDFVTLNKKNFGAKKEDQDNNIAVFKFKALDVALQLGLTVADEDKLGAMLTDLAGDNKYLADDPVLKLGPEYTEDRPDKREWVIGKHLRGLPETPSNVWRARQAVTQNKPLSEIMAPNAPNWDGRGAMTLKGASGFLKSKSDIFEDAGKYFNVSPNFQAAVAMAGTFGNEQWAGPEGNGRLAPGSFGIMQLPQVMAERMPHPYDIRDNVFAGAELLGKLLAEHQGDPARAAAAYAAWQGAKAPDEFAAMVMALMDGARPLTPESPYSKERREAYSKLLGQAKGLAGQAYGAIGEAYEAVAPRAARAVKFAGDSISDLQESYQSYQKAHPPKYRNIIGLYRDIYRDEHGNEQ